MPVLIFLTANIGDWFAYPGGTGGAVFPANYALPNGGDFEGVINFANEDMTYFFRDDISNNDPTIFLGSNKINDDPETYEWGAGSSPNKNEIQTAVAHFTYGDAALGGDPDDLWVIFAADRQVTNGSSYIDFEFLQNSLTRTGTSSGTFVSEGPDMNRTVGDVLVTIEFTQGGGAANAVIRTWQANGSGGYEYMLYTDYPSGTIFITNNIVETIVPWSIYFTDPIASGDDAGLYQYEINQWAEGAVNLSALFDQDECFNISTLFVRTRTSGSSGQSELKDFPGGPVQLELDLIPDISFTDPAPVCSPATVDLTAIVVEGCDDGTLSYWMDAEAVTAVPDETAVGAGTYYIQCSSNVNPICVDIAPVTVVVNPLPTATANNAGPVCYDAANVSLSESGGDAVSWSWSSDGAAVFSDASAQNPTVTGFADGEIFTVMITDGNGCTSSDTTTLTVYPEPTATAGNDGPVCYDAANVSLSETGGDAVSWAWSSDGAAVFSDASAQNPTVTGFADGEIFTVMITDGNGCTSSDTTTLSVYMEPTATAGNGGPVCYDAANVSLSETGGDAVSWAWSSDGAAVFSDASAQNPTVTGFADGEIFTVMITDGNGCTSSDTTTLSIYMEPTATAGNGGPVCYDAANVSLSETGGDAVSWAWSSDGAAVFSDASAQNPTVTGFADGEIFTVMITDGNGCTSSDTTTLTVYPEPTATAGNGGPVCYDAANVSLSETGGDAVSWAWSSDGAAVFSDASAQNPTVTGFADGEIFTVMITDGNGCTSSDTTTLTVYPEPTATANNGGPVCYDAANVSLSESGGDAVSWAWSSDGAAVFSDASAQNPTVTGFADGEIFTVMITDANGCTSSDTTTLTVYPEPTAIAGNGGPACYDDASVSLSESGGAAVSWSWSSDGAAVFSDASAQNPTVTGFADGEIFTVMITDANGCTSSDTTTLIVYPEPTCSASNSGPVCAGDDVMLYETGGDAVSWLWSSDGAATFNDNTLQNPTASGAVDGEIFTVTVTDANGCTSTCTTTVTVEICAQEGCTLGYWKNHTDRWECYSTCTLYSDVFGTEANPVPDELQGLVYLKYSTLVEVEFTTLDVNL